ncbi:hypothetical protein GR160_01495 [Flavobacterium sp. Sd200]|uniref:hypothetical protein n=1 Tax=Flavobacterium sp. Sd200 TaxID=2692211 RepID=UPI00136A52C0|nr:hypothetical protein [Flavobacterium sp. Sd200]MXN89888.1 hypothetical protein [Flavobacterium sp. Sd200]
MSKIYPTGYRVPRFKVLLISCIDLRLMDNIVRFMDHDNLTNRYDQFILAGTSIGAFVADGTDTDLEHIPAYSAWLTTLKQHIDLAIQLHEIRDIYILEHRNCGAYKNFIKDNKGDFDADGVAVDAEFNSHLKYAVQLKDVILKYVKESGERVALSEVAGVKKHAAKYAEEFNVHSFLMDLKGNVELLDTTKKEPAAL